MCNFVLPAVTTQSGVLVIQLNLLLLWLKTITVTLRDTLGLVFVRINAVRCFYRRRILRFFCLFIHLV